MQEVVDRQDGPDASEPRIFGAGRPKERRHQGRMPVVRVDDVGPEVRGRDQAQDSLAEESEPVPVVVILVDLRTVVQVRLVDQVDRDLSDPSDLKSGFVSRVAQPDRESCDLFVGALDRPIPWQDDPHVVAEGFQGFRQTAGHIAQTAYLGEGIRLGRREENLHRNLGVDRRPLLKPASSAPFYAARTWEKRSIRSRTSFREGFFPRRPCRGPCRPLRLVTSSSCFTPIYRGSSAMVVGRTGKRGSTRQRPSAISRSSGSLIASRRKAAKDRSRLALRRSSPRCLPRRGSATMTIRSVRCPPAAAAATADAWAHDPAGSGFRSAPTARVTSGPVRRARHEPGSVPVSRSCWVVTGSDSSSWIRASSPGARRSALTRTVSKSVVSMRLGTERAFRRMSRTRSPRPASEKSRFLRGARGPASRSGVRTTDIRGTAPTWSFIANMGWTACGTGVSRTGSSPCERKSPTTPTPRRSEPPPMRTILHRWSSRLSMSIRRPRAELASSSRRSTRNSLATGGSRAQRGWKRFCENWRDTSMRSLPRIFSRRILPARPSKFRKDRGAKEAITMSG